MNYRPTWNLKSIPDDLLKSERARRNAAKRKTFAGGPGRPRTAERCPCGEMTQARAQQRRHVCVGFQSNSADQEAIDKIIKLRDLIATTR